MIKNIYGNSSWIEVSTSGTSMPYINTTQPITGMVRMNSMMQRMEVYDGNNWVEFGNGQTSVDLSESAKQALSWAHNKMSEEAKLLELLKKHPGLKDLHDKFEMMKVLCQEQENEQ